MFEYKAVPFSVKTGFFGATIEEMHEELSKYLTEKSEQGWEFVSITEVNTDSKRFDFTIVFRRPKEGIARSFDR